MMAESISFMQAMDESEPDRLRLALGSERAYFGAFRMDFVLHESRVQEFVEGSWPEAGASVMNVEQLRADADEAYAKLLARIEALELSATPAAYSKGLKERIEALTRTVETLEARLTGALADIETLKHDPEQCQAGPEWCDECREKESW